MILNIRLIDCEATAVFTLIRIILGIEIHVNVSLFAIPSSCKTTDRKKENAFATIECICLRSFAFPIWYPRGKKRKRELEMCTIIFSCSSAFNRDHHLFHDNNCTKRNPRRRNFLENVTFVLSSARVSSV